MILSKELVLIDPSDHLTVSQLKIRHMPRLSADTPMCAPAWTPLLPALLPARGPLPRARLHGAFCGACAVGCRRAVDAFVCMGVCVWDRRYDMLKMFETGKSHMALLTRPPVRFGWLRRAAAPTGVPLPITVGSARAHSVRRLRPVCLPFCSFRTGGVWWRCAHMRARRPPPTARTPASTCPPRVSATAAAARPPSRRSLLQAGLLPRPRTSPAAPRTRGRRWQQRLSARSVACAGNMDQSIKRLGSTGTATFHTASFRCGLPSPSPPPPCAFARPCTGQGSARRHHSPHPPHHTRSSVGWRLHPGRDASTRRGVEGGARLRVRGAGGRTTAPGRTTCTPPTTTTWRATAGTAAPTAASSRAARASPSASSPLRRVEARCHGRGTCPDVAVEGRASRRGGEWGLARATAGGSAVPFSRGRPRASHALRPSLRVRCAQDVIEELLQEEIIDETDLFVDNLQVRCCATLRTLCTLRPPALPTLAFVNKRSSAPSVLPPLTRAASCRSRRPPPARRRRG